MKIDRLIIMDDLEEIQEKVENMGFTGSNEFELHYREEIADYIMREFSEREKANLTIPDVSNSFCECKEPKYNYPEMLWCDTCGKEINEDKQKEELLIAYTKWQYQDDSFDEADKLMVKTFLKDYKGNL